MLNTWFNNDKVEEISFNLSSVIRQVKLAIWETLK